MFSCEFFDISKNTLAYKTPLVAPSNNMEKEALKCFGIFIANFTVNVFSSFFTVGFLRIVCFYFLYSETSE